MKLTGLFYYKSCYLSSVLHNHHVKIFTEFTQFLVVPFWEAISLGVKKCRVHFKRRSVLHVYYKLFVQFDSLNGDWGGQWPYVAFVQGVNRGQRSVLKFLDYCWINYKGHNLV